MNAPPQLLTVADVEASTGFNVRHLIFNNVDGFELMCVVRVGRAVRIRADRLAEWIDERTGAPSTFQHSPEWREKNAVASTTTAVRRRGRATVERLRRQGLYFIASGDLVKIGVSADVVDRLNRMKTIVATDLRPLAFIHYDTSQRMRQKERQLHAEFAASRSHGEWFLLTPQIQSFIAEYGQSWPRERTNP